MQKRTDEEHLEECRKLRVKTQIGIFLPPSGWPSNQTVRLSGVKLAGLYRKTI